MEKKSSKGCVNCAYVDKEGKNMWCPFHDVPVSNGKVCNCYLAEWDSPQWTAMAKSLANGDGDNKQSVNYTKGDKIAFVITGIVLGVSFWSIFFWISVFYF